MVLIGPFTQQVLQYDQCSVMVKDFDRRQSQVPRASIFIGQGGHEGAGLNSLSMAEQAAINAGLYTTGQVSPKCSSGNCTVSPYKSIGYCSSCKDVSQDARVTIENTTAPWPLNASDIVPVTIANTSLPNGLSVAFGQYDSRSEMTYDLGVLEALKGIQVLFGAQSQFNQSSTTVGTGDCDHGNWSCQGYGAMDCSLYLCVKSYEGRIINGSFTETVTSQTPQDMSNWNLTVGPGGFDYLTTTLDTSCLDVNERSALQAAGITFNASSSWIPYAFFNASIINGATTWGDNDLVQLERRLLDRGCIYAVNSFFDNGLSLYLNGQMNGTLSGTTGMYGTYMAFNGPQLLQLAYNFGNYSFERTESLVQNISLSFSNYMRLNPGQDIYNSSFPATGDATEMKTCVQVQWAWLMLPTAVALLTLVFFVAILISSHRVPRAVNTWKSSFLPLLFCGPTPPCGHDGDYDDGNAGQDVDSLKDLAKSIKVQLVSDQKGGLRLRERYEGGLI
ncbi:hypothetical protein DOTSEDRAFT_69074 [Dothistroma septosporum NZE10]|uniref:Uncharacterized protein n=1 Tax=Dothistroma septosporum (strain NZE10 / CBS 128990) TaxID=675120 RepID=N1Q4R9_DOTSN|nr:hypothetical protein DOTSEDRAFT_69074 [Dothistroma septosporum NZE10]